MMASMNIGLPTAVARARSMMARGRAERRDEPEQTSFLRADGMLMKRPAVQGWAALYEKSFPHEGRVVFLKSGCFIDSIFRSSHRKRLLLDHDEKREVGSSDGGLEFANSPTGLAFRFPLSGNSSARQIAATVGSGERGCVSVGIRFDEYQTREIEGHQVDIVFKATLHECSLVRNGAIANTYARIVDLDLEDEMLWRACRSPGFASAQAATNIAAGVRRVTEALKRA